MGLYIVADGMGGHSNGQEASRLAVRTVVQFLWQRIKADLIDHSVVQQLLEDKLITVEEAFVHEKRNQITRCLGQSPSIEVDTFPLLLRDRDRLLLCSDGVTDLVRDEALAQILALPIHEGEQ